MAITQMAGTAVQGEVVLVVEDEQVLRDYITDVLSHAGFSVITADSADEALTLLDQRSDISAVVTDVEMPGRYNGLALAWQAGAKSRPAIIISGHIVAGEDELPDGTRFVAKPFEPATLLTELREALTRRSPST